MPDKTTSSRRKRLLALILGVIFMAVLIAFMAQPRPVSGAAEASLRVALTQV